MFAMITFLLAMVNVNLPAGPVHSVTKAVLIVVRLYVIRLEVLIEQIVAIQTVKFMMEYAAPRAEQMPPAIIYLLATFVQLEKNVILIANV